MKMKTKEIGPGVCVPLASIPLDLPKACLVERFEMAMVLIGPLQLAMKDEVGLRPLTI